MANVIKRPLNKKIKEDAWHQFFKVVKKADSSGELKDIIEALFSETEKVMIEKRLAIVCLLKDGRSYKEVGRLIDVSSATISFVKQGFKRNKNFLAKHVVYSYREERDWLEFMKESAKEIGGGSASSRLRKYRYLRQLPKKSK